MVESHFKGIMDIVKNTYHFDKLKNITATKNDNSIELVYNLHSLEDNENLDILIHVQKNAESITDLFPDANNFQEHLREKFSIFFA